MSWEGLNRRRFPRAKFPCLVKIVLDGKPADAVLTHTENVSIGGVCVIIKKHVDLFAPLMVEVDLMDGEDHIVCRGKAVWVVRRKATEAEKPSFYDVGIEFVDAKDTDRARIERTVDILMKSLQKAKA